MAVISGKITVPSGEGAEFVQVYESDDTGNPVGTGVPSDENGNYRINVRADFVAFDRVGCQRKVVPSGMLATNPDIVIQCGQELDEVVVRPGAPGKDDKRKTPRRMTAPQQEKKKSNNWMWYVGGAIVLTGAIYLYVRSRKSS